MNITVKDLLDAGVHFGHQTRRWNPKSKPYVYDHRSGVSIIDLEKTYAQLEKATAFIEEVMICISNALKNNPNKLCSLYSNSGQVLGKEGRFLLITCKNLLELSSSEEYAKDKDFVEQVQKNVQLSKNLIQLINNGDWEKTKELDLGPILN